MKERKGEGKGREKLMRKDCNIRSREKRSASCLRTEAKGKREKEGERGD